MQVSGLFETSYASRFGRSGVDGGGRNVLGAVCRYKKVDGRTNGMRSHASAPAEELGGAVPLVRLGGIGELANDFCISCPMFY
jgi:hypothetical protein